MRSPALHASAALLTIPWHRINWAGCHRQVRSLPRRMVQAVQAGAWRQVKRLRYVLVPSVAARAFARTPPPPGSWQEIAQAVSTPWPSPGSQHTSCGTRAGCRNGSSAGLGAQLLYQQPGWCPICRPVSQSGEPLAWPHRDGNHQHHRRAHLGCLPSNCHRQVHSAPHSTTASPRLARGVDHAGAACRDTGSLRSAGAG